MDYALPFPTGTVHYCFGPALEALPRLAPPGGAIILADETVAAIIRPKLPEYRILSFPAGEAYKTAETHRQLAQQLLDYEAHRGTLLIGIGGGVTTDLTGYLASTYMRGLPFAFVPTTLLGQVDAAIGGKNGVNVGLYKNILGVLRQPSFILFDPGLLSTLPDAEWSNGFAEIIKYGCIADARILAMLESRDLHDFQRHLQQLGELIAGCADVKNKIVLADEDEQGLRRILNFGHTCGHALEQLCGIPHGQAVGLGMRVSVRLSEQHAGLEAGFAARLDALLERYGLPTSVDVDIAKAAELLRLDKKRSARQINFVLLEKPGLAVVQPLTFAQIEAAMRETIGHRSW